MQILLRTVAPVVPKRERERIQMEENLKKMRCKGLLARL